MTEPVSIFIINYNGERVLSETIKSIKDQDYPLKAITLIDDGSTDKSISIVKDQFPDVGIIGLSYNTGFPNKLRRIAVDNAKTRYIFLIDNDIVLERNCLSNLMGAIRSAPNIGLCTPRLMYYNDRKRIYVCWTRFHYLCASISPLRDTYSPPEEEPLDTLGGGTMLLDKEKIDVVGTIDDSYPMGWGEDAEIYARMKIAGYRTLYIPNAVGYHHAKPFVTHRRPNAFGQAKNRWTMILTMYKLKTIILILPVLIIYEGLTLLMLIPKRMASDYLCGIKSIRSILKKRRSIQALRKVMDREFLTSGPIFIPSAYLGNPLYKFGFNCMNKIFHLYWRFV